MSILFYENAMYRGVNDNGAGNGHPLLLAAGKFARCVRLPAFDYGGGVRK